MANFPGLVGTVPRQYHPESQLLERMIDVIAYRKFHMIDKYTDTFFGIARVYLEVFNPEPQPVFNEDRSLCTFMDGKIYGYDEEVAKLRLKGHKLGGTDLEFCLHAYEEFGKDFAKTLNGSFVVVICDLKHKVLLIVNDRYRLRPLYFSCNNERLLFSSKIRAILEDEKLEREINDDAVADYFAFGHTMLGDKTLFKGINALPPASILVYRGGKVYIERYWDARYDVDLTLSEERFADQLVEAYRKAVNRRIRGDLRFGILLSGGLDSRSVVAAVDRDKRSSIATITYGTFSDCDEARVASVVAKKAETKHKFIKLNPDAIISYAEGLVYLTDGMNPVSASYHPYVYDVIRQCIDVVFMNAAGSYVLGGDFLDPYTIKAKNDSELQAILYKKMLNRGVGKKVMRKLFTTRYYNKIRNMPLISLKNAFEKIKEKNLGNKNDQFFVEHVMSRQHIVSHVLLRDYVEDASPMYDNDFFDLVRKIPPELRMNHRIFMRFFNKLSPELVKIPYQRTMIPANAPLFLWKPAMYLLIAKEIVKKIIWRLSKGKIYLPDKRDRYVSTDELFRVNEKWKRYVRKILLDENRLSKEYFNESYLRTIIQEHEIGKADHSQTISYAMTFELFLRLFLGHSYSRCEVH